MKSRLLFALLILLYGCLTSLTVAAQESATAPAVVATSNVVPSLINYNGVLKDATGRTLSSVTGVTFLLYSAEQGGAPLWLETQNVTPDKTGHYSVQLGAASKNGVPPDLFLNGEARWLGVQIGSEPEQSRVLLVAVPYAMKSVDAQTLGGLPPSAFVLAGPTASTTASAPAASSNSPSSSTASPLTSSNVTTSGGTASTISMFTTATNIQNSILTQTGTTAINVGGKLNLPATGTATALKGFNSQPQQFVASVFNSTTATAVPQNFVWQAEPVNNDKTTANGTLNLLYATGAAIPAETGLKINNKGQISFAAGQANIPGAGTVTKVLTGAGLTGGPITTTGTIGIAAGGITNADLANSSIGVLAGADLTGGSAAIPLGGSTTLNLDTTKVPLLAAALNAFTGNESVAGTVSVGGTVSAATLVGSAGSITNNLSVGTGSTFQRVTVGGTIGFVGGTGTQPPLLMNADSCCTAGNRMFWAHSPQYPTWGIYYDDNADVFHWQTAPGTDTMTVAMGGNVGINHSLAVAGNITVAGTINGGRGILITTLLGNASISGAQSGYFNMISDYVPPVNATAMLFNRCARAATAAGQVESFRSAIRTPTGGTVTVGNAYYLEPTSAGTEVIYDENNDFFTLTAGASYDFGMNFSGDTVTGFGFCSTVVQIFSD